MLGLEIGKNTKSVFLWNWINDEKIYKLDVKDYKLKVNYNNSSVESLNNSSIPAYSTDEEVALFSKWAAENQNTKREHTMSLYGKEITNQNIHWNILNNPPFIPDRNVIIICEIAKPA